jgi:hypothetical protein
MTSPMIEESKNQKQRPYKNDQVAVSPKSDNDKKSKKQGFWRRNKNALLLTVTTIILTFTLTTLFSPLPKLYDSIWAKHPDIHIYQLTDENNVLANSLILVNNFGDTDDSIRIDIQIANFDSIEKLEFRTPKEINLIGGGIGQNFAVLVIDKLMPQALEIIYLNTSLKKGATHIVAYSSSKGEVKIESITDFFHIGNLILKTKMLFYQSPPILLWCLVIGSESF